MREELKDFSLPVMLAALMLVTGMLCSAIILSGAIRSGVDRIEELINRLDAESELEHAVYDLYQLRQQERTKKHDERLTF